MAGTAQVRDLLLWAERNAGPVPAAFLKAMHFLVAVRENQKRQEVVPFDPFLHPKTYFPPLAKAC